MPWEPLGRLLDTAAEDDGIVAHGMTLLAARRWRETGRELPDWMRQDEIQATQTELAAATLLQRIREALDGPIVLVKGPELSAHYPATALRPYRDLDLIVPEASVAQSALIAAGFVAAGDEAGRCQAHHQPPLVWPGLPLGIELHDTVPGPYWMPPIAFDQLLARAEPSRTGIAGLLAPRSELHAVIVAGHAWRHVPFRRLLDVVDVAALMALGDSETARSIAAALRIERVWLVTARMVETTLGGRQPGWLEERLWADRLRRVAPRSERRERLARWLAPLWASHPTDAVRGYAALVDRDAVPVIKRRLHPHSASPNR